MKVIYFNKKEGLAKIKVTCLDDLWHLSKIIEKGDFITAQSERKIKYGGEDEKQHAERRRVALEIEVEKIVFSESVLRAQGVITAGPDDIKLHSAHTIEITPNLIFKLVKNRWHDFQIERLKEAERASTAPKILICALDDEQANFAHLTATGIKPIGTLPLRLSKKRLKESKRDDLGNVANEVINKSQVVGRILLASPLFWKEELKKVILSKEPELNKKILLADVSTGSKRAFQELTSRGTIEKMLAESQAAKQEKLVDNILKQIAKDISMCAYGLNEVKKVAQAGVIKVLLVSERFMDKNSPEFEDIEKIINLTEQNKGEVHIIDKKSEAGHKLWGLGGIAALLRYSI